MASLNKVMIIGNLGADPEMRYTPGGAAVANFRVACNRRWTNRETGEQHEETEWVRVVLWRRLAEIASQYLQKGSQVYIEGRLQTREYQDRDGNRRWSTEVIGNEMVMLGSRGESGGDFEGGRSGGGGNWQGGPPSGSPVDADDLPFE